MASIKSLIDPEWRYTRAREYKTEGKRRFSKDIDIWVIRLTKFLIAWEKASASEMDAVEQEYPDLFWAFRIYTNEGRGPRYHLEALVIAGLDSLDIANYLNLPLPIITAYEACFFDLRDHLSKSGAIRTYITARAKARGLRDMDPDPFWKRIALDEGADMLFVLWSDGRLEASDEKRYDELISSAIRRNALEAQKVRGVNSVNAGDITTEWLQLAKLEVDKLRAMAEDGGGNQFSDMIAGLLRGIQFIVAPVDEDSERGYLELSTAVNQAPHLLERLQGAAAEKEDVGIPETSE